MHTVAHYKKALVSGLLATALALSSFGAAFAQVPSVALPPSQPSTFMAAASFTPGALTAGDQFCITGSATRLIKVKSIRLNGIANTTAQTAGISLVKRSAASTGGTATNPTAVPLDSTQVVTTATATLNAYTGVPTPGAAVGTISNQYVNFAVATATTATDDLAWVWNPQMLNTEVRLRGAAQQLCVNNPSAFTSNAPTLAVEIMWTEQ